MTHQVYTIPHEENWWTRYFSFKQLLTEYPAVGEMYSDLKLKLAKEYPANIPAYTAAKLPFVATATSIAFDKYGTAKADDETIEQVHSGIHTCFQDEIKIAMLSQDEKISNI